MSILSTFGIDDIWNSVLRLSLGLGWIVFFWFMVIYVVF